MSGASLCGKASAWRAATGREPEAPPPPPPSGPPPGNAREPPPPPKTPPPSLQNAPRGASEPNRPPPAPPYVARQLEDELEVLCLQRQVHLHQQYGRGLRLAFVDMAARGERRACVNRCMWAWWAATQVTWARIQGQADAAALGAARPPQDGGAGAFGGAVGAPGAVGRGAAAGTAPLRAEAPEFTPGLRPGTQEHADAFQ